MSHISTGVSVISPALFPTANSDQNFKHPPVYEGASGEQKGREGEIMNITRKAFWPHRLHFPDFISVEG